MTPLPRPVWPGGAVVTGPVHIEQEKRRQPRRIIQLCGSTRDGLSALCDDGTVWQLIGEDWLSLPAIPQPEVQP